MEEEFFPAQQCTATPSALEEERRLFYVALTRAEKRIFISYSTSRYKNGQVVSSRPSRFIEEIDDEFLDGYIALRNTPSTFKLKTVPVAGNEKRTAISFSSTVQADIPDLDRSRLQPVDANRIVPEMIIFHPTFGTGKVISLEGLGVQKKAKVLFKEGGTRTLLLKFAKIFTQQD